MFRLNDGVEAGEAFALLCPTVVKETCELVNDSVSDCDSDLIPSGEVPFEVPWPVDGFLLDEAYEVTLLDDGLAREALRLLNRGDVAIVIVDGSPEVGDVESSEAREMPTVDAVKSYLMWMSSERMAYHQMMMMRIRQRSTSR